MATGEVVTPIGVRRLPAGEAPETASNSGSGVVDSQRPSLTRRGMFTSLRRRVTSTVERFNATVPLPLRRSKGPVTNRLPQAVPPSRQHLLDRLATIGAASDVSGSTCRVSAVAAPVADVRVDAHRCSGCGMCARYCPTGALAFSMSTSSDDIATTFALALRTSLCIDCGICAVACPEQAISYGEEITATSFGAPEWATVASGPLIDCTACGLPTAASVDSRCFSCRLGTGVVTALRDDAGLMADLLARSPADPVR
jgi:ferredoxin